MTARQLRPQTRRVNRGRSHSYVVDGQPFDGVTTLIGGGIPKPALVGWAARTVAEFVASHRDILTRLDDQELVDLTKGVPYRDRDQAANRGTEVHGYAARLSKGEQVDVPEELLGLVDAFLQWEGIWQPRNVRVERTVISRRYRYAGTFDMLCELDDLGLTLLDIKTGRSGVFAETALQLSAYGNAETMLEDDGTELPMPKPESYAALWLTHDAFEFIPVAVDEGDYREFLYCAQTHRWMKERAGERATRPVIGAPLLPPKTRADLKVVGGG